MKINRVISVCMSKDLPYWEIASRNLIKFVESDSYEVVVPDGEVELFIRATPSAIQVVPESRYCGARDLAFLKQRFPPELRERSGWYLQQFLKMEAIRQGRPDATCLVWDADTVPLRHMKFFDESGRFVYRMGIHRPAIHQPYFDTIKELLNIDRETDSSFISQCFPINGQRVRDLCNQIAQNNNVENWWDAVVEHISRNPSGCGFSEYETMGAFLLKNHREEITMLPGQYFRPGNSLFPTASLDSLPVSRIAESLEYIAYDNYDSTVFGGLNIGCGDSRMETTFDGKRFLNADIARTHASDLTLNLNYPLPLADGSISHIVAHNILEHVDDLMFSIKELDRVLSVGGVLQIEVPHIGSYNHGTDVTHRRGLTFDSFNFLFPRTNYLYSQGVGPFKYRLVSFNRENWMDGRLVRERFDQILPLGSYPEWLAAVRNFEIPGTFGYIFQKI
jgi:SAM-dependent methyltransferase